MNIHKGRVACPVTKMADTDPKLERRVVDAGGDGIGGLTEVGR